MCVSVSFTHSHTPSLSPLRWLLFPCGTERNTPTILALTGEKLSAVFSGKWKWRKWLPGTVCVDFDVCGGGGEVLEIGGASK